MGCESFDVVRFDLGPLLHSQMRVAKFKSAYNYYSKMLFIFRTMLVGLFRWIHLASVNRCVLGLVSKVSSLLSFPLLLVSPLLRDGTLLISHLTFSHIGCQFAKYCVIGTSFTIDLKHFVWSASLFLLLILSWCPFTA